MDPMTQRFDSFGLETTPSLNAKPEDPEPVAPLVMQPDIKLIVSEDCKPGVELTPTGAVKPVLRPKTAKKTWEVHCFAKSQLYEYQALKPNEIRLIRILNRGTFEDILFSQDGIEKVERDEEFRLSCERTFTVECEIKTYELSSESTPPPYAALSYCWGDDSVKRPIFLPIPDDSKDTRYHRLMVGENLFQALRQIKPMEEGVEWMWIDAACINQMDDDEKGEQVVRMYDIYNKSKYVMLWLGVGSNNSNSFMEWINKETRTAWDHRNDPGFDERNWVLSEPFKMVDELNHFIQRPYWTRAWVRQELSAQSALQIYVACGRRHSLFLGIQLVMRSIVNHAITLQKLMQEANTRDQTTLDIIAAVQKQGFQKMSDTLQAPIGDKARLVHIIETWLRRIHLWGGGLQATDPRDLIFSLCSDMTHWKDPGKKIVPSYRKTARVVYIEAVHHFFQSGWTNVLAWRNAPHEDGDDILPDLGLPSFVPDWRRQIKPVHFIQLPPFDGSSEQIFKAGDSLPGKDRPISSTDATASSIQVEAYIVDTLCSVGKIIRTDSPYFRANSVHGWIKDLEQLYADHEKAIKDKRTSPEGSGLPESRASLQCVHDRLWRIPILHVETVDGELRKASLNSRDEYNILRDAPDNPTVGEEMDMPKNYVNVAVKACVGNRFWVSQNGYAGLGYKTIRPGHKIALIPGLCVPLILESAWEDTYRIIGDSYAEGLMYGEMKDKVQKANEAAEDAVKDGRHVLQTINII